MQDHRINVAESQRNVVVMSICKKDKKRKKEKKKKERRLFYVVDIQLVWISSVVYVITV